MVSYGLPGDNKYEEYKQIDLDAEGRAYNATLWQKGYDETAGNANGLNYKMIASLAGNTPKIRIGDTVVLNPVENPDVDIDITDPDQPELTFSLPRAVKFWYGDRLGKRNDITYIDTSEEYKDYGIGDYYINKETGFIYLITQKNGNTCTFVFQAYFQAPTPEVDTVVISPYKNDGTINEPSVEKRYTNDEKTQWELIFNLPKAPLAEGEAEIVGPLEKAKVDTSVFDEDTILFDFKIPRGSRIIPGEKLEELDMTNVRPGDYFLNALTGQLYLLNTDNQWVLQPGTLKGPPGDALHIVKSFELEETTDFENNLANGKQHILDYYTENEPDHEFKSDQLYEITWVETVKLENGNTQELYSYYWYYVADDGNWGRVELAGGGGLNSIDNEFNPETAGPVTDRVYSVHYINELIKDEPIADPVGGDGTKLRRTTLSTNLLIELLSWGGYEDALGDLDPVIDPDAISSLEIVSGPSKTVYEYGDNFDPNGMIIRAVKEDNSIIDVDITEYTFIPMILNKIGTQTIIASYKDATITFDVTVNDKVVAIPTWKEDLYFTNNFQSVDDVDMWNNYNKSYMTISGESSGKNVGSYEAVFTLKDGYVWSDGSKEIKTVQWGIQKAIINSVPQQDGILTYDGSIQTPNWLNYNENQLTISGDTSGTEVGKYNAIFTVKDGYRWSDTDDLSKTVQWEIIEKQVIITLSINEADYGQVSGGGSYKLGETVTVTATPKYEYLFYFVEWTDSKGNKLSDNSIYSFIANEDIELIGKFLAFKTLYANSSPQAFNIGNVEINGENISQVKAKVGETFSLKAIPNSNNTFIKWGENFDTLSTDKDINITITNDTRDIYGIFKENVSSGQFGCIGAYKGLSAYSIVFGNDIFMGVFHEDQSYSESRILYSLDGFDWKDTGIQGEYILYDGKEFIVTGWIYNVIYKSADGITWREIDLTGTFEEEEHEYCFKEIISDGESNYIGITLRYIYHSINGEQWTKVFTFNEDDIYHKKYLVFGQNKFIVLTNTRLLYTLNGINWENLQKPEVLKFAIQPIYDGVNFITMSSSNGTILKSTNGTDWENIEITESMKITPNSIQYINNEYVVTGESENDPYVLFIDSTNLQPKLKTYSKDFLSNGAYGKNKYIFSLDGLQHQRNISAIYYLPE